MDTGCFLLSRKACRFRCQLSIVLRVHPASHQSTWTSNSKTMVKLRKEHVPQFNFWVVTQTISYTLDKHVSHIDKHVADSVCLFIGMHSKRSAPPTKKKPHTSCAIRRMLIQLSPYIIRHSILCIPMLAELPM